MSFPNLSRSFDPKRNRVRFWGYTRAIEISFFVEADALRKLSPDMNDAEAGILGAFDAARTRIHEAAGRVHARGRSGTYTFSLSADDF